MMAYIQQLQEHHHDYAGRIEHNMSGLIDEMEKIRVGVKGWFEYMHHVGVPPPQFDRGGQGRARGRQ